MRHRNVLTEKQRKVLLTRVLCGSNGEAAHRLNVSIFTVANTLKTVYSKLNAHDLANAYHKYLLEEGVEQVKTINADFG